MPEFFSYFTDSQKIIEVGGLLAVLILVYIETGFFLGLIFPGGDYTLIATGLFTALHIISFPFYIVLPLLITAAFLGDFTGYYQGLWLGPKLFDKPDNRLFKQEYVTRSKAFYQKYGLWAFIAGRFMPIIRTFIPMIAGVSQLQVKYFALFNLAGAFCWVGGLTSIGYFLGKRVPWIIDYSGYLVVIIIILASAPMWKVFLTRHKKNN